VRADGRRFAVRIDEEDTVADELIELTEKQSLRREEAAARLRDLADQLARHNKLEVVKDGRRWSIEVPDQVELKVEVELGESNEIEVEITW
jgi:amphi-Trp domain-containing protein